MAAPALVMHRADTDIERLRLSALRARRRRYRQSKCQVRIDGVALGVQSQTLKIHLREFVPVGAISSHRRSAFDEPSGQRMMQRTCADTDKCNSRTAYLRRKAPPKQRV